MRVVITEDIIRNALNESIDEFMINEAMLNEANWGKAIKGAASNAWDYAKKAGNFVKNAAAMWMDYRTGGRWNQKYGINPKGNNNAIGSYYINNWLKKHQKKIYDIVWGNYYGNRMSFNAKINGRSMYFDHDWQNNFYKLSTNIDRQLYTYILYVDRNNIPYSLKVFDEYGREIANSEGNNIKKKDNNPYWQNDISYYCECPNNMEFSTYITAGEDNSTVEAYIAKNCRPENFLAETQNGLGKGNIRSAFVSYLASMQKENADRIKDFNGGDDKNNKSKSRDDFDYDDVLKEFTLGAFYEWWRANANLIPDEETTMKYIQQQQDQNQQGQAQQGQGQQGQPGDGSNPYNPSWSQNVAKAPNYNPQQDQYYNQAASPFGNDLGHDEPDNNKQYTGKKQKGWRPTNDVPIFNQNK